MILLSCRANALTPINSHSGVTKGVWIVQVAGNVTLRRGHHHTIRASVQLSSAYSGPTCLMLLPMRDDEKGQKAEGKNSVLASVGFYS